MARWYYYPSDRTTALQRLRNRLFRKPVPDFPKTVVIETQFGCNARCVFCQYSQVKDELPRGRMTPELFEKIARECAGRPVERFILCLDNEPLLDASLPERFAALRTHCPQARRNLTTNASLLTPERIEQLLGGGLVDELFLSINGDSKAVYEATMGLPYERVFENLVNLCDWLRRHPERRRVVRVRVNTVRTALTAGEIPAICRRWRAEGFEVHVIALDNRGAGLDADALSREPLKPYRFCRRLFHTLVVTLEGAAVLCCVDYKREVRLGDMNTQTVYEVWNGPRATQLRREYLAHDFRNLRICATCKIGR